MSKVFYPKLAAINIKKNGKFYLPYLLTSIGVVSMFYMMCAITYNSGMNGMPSGKNVSTLMGLGSIVVGIFSAIFLFYTNSFLMKRRKKELGLYNILGMEKRHIGKILFFETVIISLTGIAGGLLVGILLDKLITLLLIKMLNFSIPLKFEISAKGIAYSAALFGAIFFLILLFNFLQLKLSKPIELLHGSNAGEKEPKTKALLAILGAVCLGAGYWIAITTDAPLEAMNLFFIAVLLVIAGTFLLFTAGSIALLKILRKNKKYYYKTRNFTAVSGMIYRMKQNAAGLANICILSTMVLVMVSTTVSLYIGVEDALISRFPKDIGITAHNPQDDESEAMLKKVQDTVKQQGRAMSDLSYYKYLSFAAEKDENTFLTNKSTYSAKTASLTFITAKDYLTITGKSITLSDNEILIYNKNGKINDSITLFDKAYAIKEHLDSLPINDDYTDSVLETYFIVVSNDSVLKNLCDSQVNAYKDNASGIKFYVGFNIDGSEKDEINCYNALSVSLKNAQGKAPYIECRQETKTEFYAIYGGLLFLGLFLGLLFLMATVLIIYYKQISEGYDDKNRFEIMQKVGMSKDEIRSSIRSQVLTVFFIPIIMAAIHILAAFKMITKLLALLGLTNLSLFAWCTVACVVIFSMIYAFVYALTARVYYKIVC